MFDTEFSKPFRDHVEEELSSSGLFYISEPFFDRKFNGVVRSVWVDPYQMLLMGVPVEFVRDRYYDL